MNIFLAKLQQIPSKGFTLVEVMVSMSLFIVVVTMSVGTMIVLIDANKKAQTVESLINNVTIAVDSMTREIRKGFDYQCSKNSNQIDLDSNNNISTRDCPAGGDYFAFTESGSSLTENCSAGNNRIAYRLNVVDGNGYIERNICGQSWSPVTSPEINIASLNFVVDHTDNDDIYPPLVNIIVTGEAGEYDIVETDFELQTTVTQQLLDTSN